MMVWELMEMEAVEKYYLNRPDEGFYAEKPGILIVTGPFVAPDAKRCEFFTVWFGQDIGHWNFRTLPQARAKVREILAAANRPLQVVIEDRKGKRTVGNFGGGK